MYDDIVIGSGLSALGTVCGLPAGRSVLVLGGPAKGKTSFYPETSGTPSAHLGHGGLGSFWHGVIPTAMTPSDILVGRSDFLDLFECFYSRSDIGERFGKPWLFVPRKPIRPVRAWPRLVSERSGKLRLSNALVSSFSVSGNAVAVVAGRELYHARRLWIAAGALHTPALLKRSLPAFEGARSSISDHAIVYLGQVDRLRHPEIAPPVVDRSHGGFWLRSGFDEQYQSLYTLKPARFSYRRLDHGIEQRAAFGLPTGGVISKLARAGSMGLIAEAAYNKFGLFPSSRILSAYAQVRVPDAFSVKSEATLSACLDIVAQAINMARQNSPWNGCLAPSARPELFVRGIHLHHSVDAAALQSQGINTAGALIQVVDASCIENIGAEHHSFKVMASAFGKARNS